MANNLDFIYGHLPYWLFIILMLSGLFIVVSRGNLIKKIVGLNIFQTSVFMFYISIGKITGGTAPILLDKSYSNSEVVYSNPLPHVLILTAIVVGIATTSLGLALIIKIREEYDTVEEDDIQKMDEKDLKTNNKKNVLGFKVNGFEIKESTLDLINHLPILQVLTPMLIAPILIVLNNKTLSWLLSFVGALGCLIISLLLIQTVSDGSTLTYFLGGWAPPIGIEYRIDAANSILLFLISIISVLVLIFSYSSLQSEIPEEKHTLFYACFLLCLTGLLGVVATADIFNVFVFLEISSLSTYVLVAQGSYLDRRALSASFNYLIMGTIGATFFVIGIGYIYMATGSLNMMDIAERVSELGDSRTVQAGFAFIVVGMGLKLAMIPLHVWLPNAYAFAPIVVTCFLAATATKVALYVLIRFVFSVFNYE